MCTYFCHSVVIFCWPEKFEGTALSYVFLCRAVPDTICRNVAI
jgi:hypothetical protein